MSKKDIVDTRIRIPTTLYDRIKAMAEQERRSINAQMLVLLEKAVASSEQSKPGKPGDNQGNSQPMPLAA